MSCSVNEQKNLIISIYLKFIYLKYRLLSLMALILQIESLIH